MSNISPYENLVLAVLALRDGYIDRKQLAAWHDGWIHDRSRDVGPWLVQQGFITPEQHSLLEERLRQVMALHDGDPQASFKTLCSDEAEVPEVTSGFLPDLQQLVPELMATVSGAEAPRQPAVPPAAGLEGRQDTLAGGRFRVLSLHDRGGLGQVMLARDEEVGRTVALKEIRPDRTHDAISQERFVAEGEITGGLEHPGIVPVYGLGRYPDDRPYYVMRFIRGSHLGKAIDAFHEGAAAAGYKHDQWLLEMHKLLRRFIDVCDAIGYAHSRGVVHRDLKPGNVMLGKFGETLVVDWGLAKIVGRSGEAASTDEPTLQISSGSGSSATLAGSAMGTPAYMSPEQAAGDLEALGPATDVYSLGAMLYCVLTGKAPFSAGRDILKRVKLGDFAPPRLINPQTPKPLEAICLKAMSRRPADRYQSPAELAQELERWIADQRVDAYRESRVERLARWARRHRTAVRAGVLALAVVAMIFAAATVVVRGAWKREAVAWDEAAGNFVQARESVDRWLTGVGETLRYYPGANRTRATLLEQAAKEYERFVLEKNDDPDLELERGRTYLRLGHLRLLLEDFDRAREAYDQAAAVFDGLLSRQGGNLECHVERANCQTDLGAVAFRSGQRQAAAKHFDEAIRQLRALDPQDAQAPVVRTALAEALINRGELLKDAGAREQSEKVLREALSCLVTSGAAPQGTASGSAAAQATGTPADTQRRSRSLQRTADAHDLLGRVLAERGRYAEALAETEAAIRTAAQLVELEPDNPQHWDWQAVTQIYLGSVLRLLGRADEEAEAYRQAGQMYRTICAAMPGVAKFEASLAMTQFDHGNLLYHLGHVSDAETELSQARTLAEKLIRGNPASAEYWDAWACCGDNLGELWRDRGELEKAEAMFREAIQAYQDLVASAGDDRQLAPVQYRQSLALCQSHLGQTLGLAGRYADADQAFVAAIEALSELAANSPLCQDKLAEVHQYRGVLLHGQQKLSEAAAEFRLGVELWRQLAGAPQAAAEHRAHLAWLLTNCVQPEFRDPPEAVRLATALTAEVPDNADYRNILGAALYRDGQWAAAVETLQQAGRLRKIEHPRDGLFLALAYGKLGQSEAAKAAYETARGWLEQNLPRHAELGRIQQEAAVSLGLSVH